MNSLHVGKAGLLFLPRSGAHPPYPEVRRWYWIKGMVLMDRNSLLQWVPSHIPSAYTQKGTEGGIKRGKLYSEDCLYIVLN